LSETLLSFYLNDRYLGVDITRVKEMNRRVEYTVVPGAPPEVVGLLNLRGQVVSLLDLNYLLSGEEAKPLNTGEVGMAKGCVVLKSWGGGDTSQVGFVIDQPGDVVEVEESLCEPPPANLGGMDRGMVRKVARLEANLLLILDVDKLRHSQP